MDLLTRNNCNKYYSRISQVIPYLQRCWIRICAVMAILLRFAPSEDLRKPALGVPSSTVRAFRLRNALIQTSPLPQLLSCPSRTIRYLTQPCSAALHASSYLRLLYQICQQHHGTALTHICSSALEHPPETPASSLQREASARVRHLTRSSALEHLPAAPSPSLNRKVLTG